LGGMFAKAFCMLKSWLFGGLGILRYGSAGLVFVPVTSTAEGLRTGPVVSCLPLAKAHRLLRSADK